MSSTSYELQPLELKPDALLRPLGAFEELYCLFDQDLPVNGALAAQITGNTTVQQWRDALDAVQQRHPLLSVCIDTTFNRVPHFRRVVDRRIPLRVVTSPGAQWQREIAEEINAPFTPNQAPLFRAVLLHEETHCIFILSSHHAVCDGSSRMFLLRDVLLALSGHTLVTLPLAPSREVLFGAQQRTSTKPGLPSLTAQRPSMPHVEGIKITPELTIELRRRAREEGVTIHAAISAALAIAGRAIDENWRNNPLRIMSPVEIRDILGLKDQCMVSLAGGEISIAPDISMSFWDLARFARHGLSTAKTRDNISNMIDLQSRAVGSNLTVEQASQLKRSAFNAQVMFSNVGRLPFDSIFGPLKLETIWAPVALRGIEGEQTLGAVTVNGSAAPHAHQPCAYLGPARSYRSRAAQSLCDPTQFSERAQPERFSSSGLRLGSRLFCRKDRRRACGLTLRKLLLRFSNHLQPQIIRIRIENRVGVCREDEPRPQFHLFP